MIHGVYLSAQGASAQQLRLDVIANNLANASTNGFRRDVATFRVYEPDEVRRLPQHLVGQRENEVGAITLDRIRTIHTTAPLKNTGKQLDLALAGDGFLHVADDTGTYLTRDGSLTLNRQRQLITTGGMRVLDTAGVPVVIPPTALSVEFDANGQVRGIDGNGDHTILGRLDLVQAPHDQLEKAGHNLFRTDATLQAARDVSVKQGYIEQSGTDPTREIVELTAASRLFETNINMLRLQDESLGRLLQAVAG